MEEKYNFKKEVKEFDTAWKEFFKDKPKPKTDIDKPRLERFMKESWIKTVPAMYPMIQAANSLEEINKSMVGKNYQKALDTIKKLKKLNLEPQVKEVVCGLEIECLISLGKIKQAKEKIAVLLDMNKENPHAYLYRAQLELSEGDLGKALEMIDKSIQFADRNDMRHPDYYFLKGKILKKMGKDYQEWIEKGKELHEETAERLKKDMERAGIKYKEKGGFIYPEK